MFVVRGQCREADFTPPGCFCDPVRQVHFPFPSRKLAAPIPGHPFSARSWLMATVSASHTSAPQASRTRSPRSTKPDGLRELSKGLSIAAEFCPPELADPFDSVQWELRSAQIKDESGKLMFEQKDVEIPAGWTQLATNVIVSKYFYGENGTTERERSVKQLIHRVTRTIADWGTADGYFASPSDGEQFYRELTWLCLNQHGAFNSPVWFNVGLYHQYGVEGTKCNW